MGAITRSISNNLTTGLGAGLVKQVVTATNSTQNNVASTSFADTNLTANITPSATSSKILVMVQQQIVADRDNEDAYSALRLLRASTVLETFDKAQWDEAGGVGAVKAGSLSTLIYLDSPSSTSAVTYHTEGKIGATSNNGTARFQHNNETSTITLMEILA
tara:strand:+ start:30 stop:512 length:483 start_codon:yes stop_codon:yes gene_type:complete